MARFVPARPATPTSPAEGKVLEWLAGLDDTWTVLHSVGIADHETKPWAEADVVLVGPSAVLVLEVKGGRIERRDGLWGFRDRFDRITWKAEGPYAQAGGAAAALRRHLVQGGVISERVRVHWAVVLPDVIMPEAGPDVLRDVTLDASRPWGSVTSEIADLVAYWSRRLSRTHGLDQATRDAVVQRIRGDLSLWSLPSLTAAQVLTHQQRLTAEQLQLLRAADDNDRLLVSGRAGTGKSALALSIARGLREGGRSTTYVVYNRALGRRAARALEGTGVNVTTVDALALRVARATDPHLAAPQDDAGWRRLRSLASGLPRTALHEALVLDEAQDIDAAGLALLDNQLVGGLSGGFWRAFHDPGQDIFGTGGGPAALTEQHPARMRLTRNCRSTKQIASATAILCRIVLDLDTPVVGPVVTFEWWSTEAEHDDALLRTLHQKIAAYGQDQVLVVGRRLLSDIRARQLDDGLRPNRLRDVRNSDVGPFLATTASVKGLEAVAVIVHGVEDLASESVRRFLYTACSRASVDLTVMLDRTAKSEFALGGAWFGSRLAEDLKRRPVQPPCAPNTTHA